MIPRDYADLPAPIEAQRLRVQAIHNANVRAWAEEQERRATQRAQHGQRTTCPKCNGQALPPKGNLKSAYCAPNGGGCGHRWTP